MSPQDGFLLQDKVVPRLPEAGQSRGNATSNPSATGCCTGTSSFGCTDFANRQQARLPNHRQNEVRHGRSRTVTDNYGCVGRAGHGVLDYEQRALQPLGFTPIRGP
jgi:hypothetical protein